MSDPYSMRQAKDIICHMIENALDHDQNDVPYLEGDPGIGKTAMHFSIYSKYRRYKIDYLKQPVVYLDRDGRYHPAVVHLPGVRCEKVDNVLNPDGFTHFVAYVAPEREPTDWGLPMPNAERDAINMLPLIDFKFAETDRPYIFLDEVDKANNMMQNVLGRVMNEKKVGSIVFPRGTFVAAAGNKITNRAGGFTANTHIKNRRVHIPVAVNPSEWIEDVGIPWDLHTSVVSYIRTDPGVLHKFDSNAPSFPSPRSWTKTGLRLNKPMDTHVERALIEGNIGVEASNMFYGHLQIFRSLRNPELIVRNPTKVPLPEGKNATAVMYCEITSLAKYLNADNAEAIATYFNRVPGEYSYIGYRDVLARNKSVLVKTKQAQKWLIDNATMIKATE